MPRRKHFTNRTAGEAQAMFEDILGTIGGAHDSTFAQRVLAIPLDGVSLGDRRNEMQKADSTFYDKEFIEGLSAVRMLVTLGLDATVQNVKRRDSPDVCVEFSDRPDLYVEQTMLQEYDGMTFARHLDELNRALGRLSASDETFAHFCGSGFYSVRLTDPGVSARGDYRSIVSEIAALATTIRAEAKLLKPDSAAYPVLAQYAPNVFYYPGRVPNGAVCNQDAGVYDPHATWIPSRLHDAIFTKRQKAKGYDIGARPLWLLVDLDAERGIYAPFARPTIEKALIGIDLVPYERIIVSISGAPPVVSPGL